MSHFALVNENDEVVQVVVAEQGFIDTLAETPAGCEWVQTSYNTKGNKHVHPVTGEINTKAPLKGNYAGIGMKLDRTNDIFMEKQPYPSWAKNVANAKWEPPTPMPEEGMWWWDEDTLSWVEIT